MRTRGECVTDTQAHITGGAQHRMKTGSGVFDQQRLRTSRRQPHYTGWGALDTWSAHLGKGSPPGVCPRLSLAGPGVSVDPQGSASGSSGRCYSQRPGNCPLHPLQVSCTHPCSPQGAIPSPSTTLPPRLPASRKFSSSRMGSI